MVVIGAGAGGLVSAAGSAGVGAKVAIIEKDLMGGDQRKLTQLCTLHLQSDRCAMLHHCTM